MTDTRKPLHKLFHEHIHGALDFLIEDILDTTVTTAEGTERPLSQEEKKSAMQALLIEDQKSFNQQKTKFTTLGTWDSMKMVHDILMHPSLQNRKEYTGFFNQGFKTNRLIVRHGKTVSQVAFVYDFAKLVKMLDGFTQVVTLKNKPTDPKEIPFGTLGILEAGDDLKVYWLKNGVITGKKLKKSDDQSKAIIAKLPEAKLSPPIELIGLITSSYHLTLTDNPLPREQGLPKQDLILKNGRKIARSDIESYSEAKGTAVALHAYEDGGLLGLTPRETETDCVTAHQVLYYIRNSIIQQKINEIDDELKANAALAQFDETALPSLLKEAYQFLSDSNKLKFIQALIARPDHLFLILNSFQYKPGTEATLDNVMALKNNIQQKFYTILTPQPSALLKVLDCIIDTEKNLATINFSALPSEDAKRQFILSLSKRNISSQIDILNRPHVKPGLGALIEYLNKKTPRSAADEKLLKCAELASSNQKSLYEKSFDELKEDAVKQQFINALTKISAEERLVTLNQQLKKKPKNIDLLKAALPTGTERGPEIAEVAQSIELVKKTATLQGQSLKELKEGPLAQLQCIHALLAMPHAIERRKWIVAQSQKSPENLKLIFDLLHYKNKNCTLYRVDKLPDNKDTAYNGQYVFVSTETTKKVYYFDGTTGEGGQIQLDVPKFEEALAKVDESKRKKEILLNPEQIHRVIENNARHDHFSIKIDINDYFSQSHHYSDCLSDLSIVKTVQVMIAQKKPYKDFLEKYKQQFLIELLLKTPEERRKILVAQYREGPENIEKMLISLFTEGPHQEEFYKTFPNYEGLVKDVQNLTSMEFLLKREFSKLDPDEQAAFFIGFMNITDVNERLYILNHQNKLNSNNLKSLREWIEDEKKSKRRPLIRYIYSLIYSRDSEEALVKDIQYGDRLTEIRLAQKINYLNVDASYIPNNNPFAKTAAIFTCNDRKFYPHTHYCNLNDSFQDASLFNVMHIIALLQINGKQRNHLLSKDGDVFLQGPVPLEVKEIKNSDEDKLCLYQADGGELVYYIENKQHKFEQKYQANLKKIKRYKGQPLLSDQLPWEIKSVLNKVLKELNTARILDPDSQVFLMGELPSSPSPAVKNSDRKNLHLYYCNGKLQYSKDDIIYTIKAVVPAEAQKIITLVPPSADTHALLTFTTSKGHTITGVERANRLLDWLGKGKNQNSKFKKNEKLWPVFNRFGNFTRLVKTLNEIVTPPVTTEATQEEFSLHSTVLAPGQAQEQKKAREQLQLPIKGAIALLAALVGEETVSSYGLIINYLQQIETIDGFFDILVMNKLINFSGQLIPFREEFATFLQSIKKYNLSSIDNNDQTVLKEEIAKLKNINSFKSFVNFSTLKKKIAEVKLLRVETKDQKQEALLLPVTLSNTKVRDDSHLIADIYFDKPEDYLKTYKIGDTKSHATICSITGKRPEQQDRAIVGEARHCQALTEQQIKNVLKETLETLHKKYGDPGKGLGAVGSTVTTSIAWREKSKELPNQQVVHVHTAQIGDSDAVIAKRNKRTGQWTLEKLTHANHTRSNETENTRILAKTHKLYSIDSPQRVGEENLGEGKGTYTTRGLGNLDYEKYGLTHDPDCFYHSTVISAEEEIFTLHVTDGMIDKHAKTKEAVRDQDVELLKKITDVLNGPAVKDKKSIDPAEITLKMVENAYEGGSKDNITVVMTPISEEAVFTAVLDGNAGNEVADAAAKNLPYELNYHIQNEVQRSMQPAGAIGTPIVTLPSIELQQSQIKIKALEEENKTLGERIRALEKETAEEASDELELAAAIAKSLENPAEVKKQLTEELETFKKENAELKIQINSLKEQVASRSSESLELKNHMETLNTKVSQMMEALKIYETTNQQVKNEVKKRMENEETLRKETEKLKIEIQNLKKQNEKDIIQLNQESKQNIEKAKKAQATAEEQVKQLNLRIITTDEKCDQAQLDACNARDKTAQVEKEYKQRLQIENEKFEQTIKSLEDKLTANEIKLAALQKASELKSTITAPEIKNSSGKIKQIAELTRICNDYEQYLLPKAAAAEKSLNAEGPDSPEGKAIIKLGIIQDLKKLLITEQNLEKFSKLFKQTRKALEDPRDSFVTSTLKTIATIIMAPLCLIGVGIFAIRRIRRVEGAVAANNISNEIKKEYKVTP